MRASQSPLPTPLRRPGVLDATLVKAGQEFGGDVGTFIDWKGQHLTEKFLRLGRHNGILCAPVQANKTTQLRGVRAVGRQIDRQRTRLFETLRDLDCLLSRPTFT